MRRPNLNIVTFYSGKGASMQKSEYLNYYTWACMLLCGGKNWWRSEAVREHMVTNSISSIGQTDSPAMLENLVRFIASQSGGYWLAVRFSSRHFAAKLQHLLSSHESSCNVKFRQWHSQLKCILLIFPADHFQWKEVYSRKRILWLPQDRCKMVIISVFYRNKCHQMIVKLSTAPNLGPGKNSHHIRFLQE